MGIHNRTSGHSTNQTSPWDITRSDARLEGLEVSRTVLKRSSESQDTLTSDLINSELHEGFKDFTQHSIRLDFNTCIIHLHNTFILTFAIQKMVICICLTAHRYCQCFKSVNNIPQETHSNHQWNALANLFPDLHHHTPVPWCNNPSREAKAWIPKHARLPWVHCPPLSGPEPHILHSQMLGMPWQLDVPTEHNCSGIY